MLIKIVSVKEFKDKATQLLREKEAVIITRRGIPVAKLEPIDKLKGLMLKARLEMKEANISEKEAIELLKEAEKEI